MSTEHLGNLQIVPSKPNLTVTRGGLHDGKLHMAKRHREVRETVCRAIAKRPRGMERPVRALYDIAGGVRQPFGPIIRTIEGIARLRDYAHESDLHIYTEAIVILGELVMNEALEAVQASEERRRIAAQHTDNGGAA